MRARDFGVTEDPDEAAREDVAPYLALSPQQRFAGFMDLIRFYDGIWRSIDPALRARYEASERRLDDPGHWWERVPH